MEKQEITRQIREFDADCHDEYINMNRITTDGNTYSIGKNLIEDTRQVSFYPYAECQILQRLNIPIRYYRSCPSFLKEQNFNHWSIGKNKEYLLRFYKDSVRGFLSNRFSTSKDDKDVFPIILNNLTQQIEITSFHKTMEISQLDMTFSDTNAHTPDGTKINVGIRAINSEVGASAFTILPRIELGNRFTVVNLHGDGITRMIHVGDINIEKVRNALIEAENVAEKAAANLVLLGTEVVKQPIKELKAIFSKYSDIPEELMKMSEQELLHSQNRTTRIELASIIMKCVENLPNINKDLKKRLSAQSAVGELLGIFTNTDQVINQLMGVIE